MVTEILERQELALEYVQLVKCKFGDRSQVYNCFLDTMREFMARSIGMSEVVLRVCELFKDRPELSAGFNNFLPAGRKIEAGCDRSVAEVLPGVLVIVDMMGSQHTKKQVDSSIDPRCYF